MFGSRPCENELSVFYARAAPKDTFCPDPAVNVTAIVADLEARPLDRLNQVKVFVSFHLA